MKERDTEEARARWEAAKKKATEMQEEAQRNSFREMAKTELNRPTAIGMVTKIRWRAPFRTPAHSGHQRRLWVAARGGPDQGRIIRPNLRCEVGKNMRFLKRDRTVKAELHRSALAVECAAAGYVAPTSVSPSPFYWTRSAT